MMLRALVVLLSLLVGLEGGIRYQRTHEGAPTILGRFTTFWLADSGTPPRVNYSRATAFTGLCLTCVTFGVVLARYSPKGGESILTILLLGCGGLLGINLGQFGIAQTAAVKMAGIGQTQVGGGGAASGGAVSPPPARRDSGTGAPPA